MMDEMDNQPDYLGENHNEHNRDSTRSVDLNENNEMTVDISDSVSERNKVKFTVHTKTTMKNFSKSDFRVVRQHEEFLWLHDCFEDNEEYHGIIIPPTPPRPEFELSREKLQKLGEGEGKMTPEEYKKFKIELEDEYLATFKKTVAMHEVFLQRISKHKTLSSDHNFQVFLEYGGDLKVRGKNKKEKISGFFKTVTQTVDEVLLSSSNDTDDFFMQQKEFLVTYHAHIKDATVVADRVVIKRKDVSDSYVKMSIGFSNLAAITSDNKLEKIGEFFEKLTKIESRLASDEDLKLSDTLRYYERDSSAAKNLLFKRLRLMTNFETANKNLDKARMKQKDVATAEHNQIELSEKFESISTTAKSELKDFKHRRINHYRQNFKELAELEIKHSKCKTELLKETLELLRKD